jgi:CheY-like chemotaxis protein
VLGIGLTLVQNSVAQLGGTVEALSEGLGKGSEFSVRLPKAPSQLPGSALQKEIPSPEGHALAQQKVLVVDDNADAADSLAILLRMAGCQVEVAYDGSETLELASSFKPDVVLLDIGLPGMDGYEVARKLREMPEMKEIVLVAVTGYGRDDDRIRTRDAGFQFHLTKPINHQSLRSLLANAGK